MWYFSYLWSKAKFSDMDKVQKQRGSIVLYKEKKRCGLHTDRICEQSGCRPAARPRHGHGNGWQRFCIHTSAAFKLPDFYDRYSPHAYIDYSRVYVRHPKPKGNTHCRKATSNCWNKAFTAPRPSKHTVTYFSDFMEYHKGRNIDRLKVPDINKYILYLVNEKKISVSQQNMRINAIKFYYEQVKAANGNTTAVSPVPKSWFTRACPKCWAKKWN